MLRSSVCPFDPDLGRQVRELAKSEEESVSAFLAEAARQRIRHLILQQYVNEAAARRGTTPEAMAEAGERLIAAGIQTTGRKGRTRQRIGRLMTIILDAAALVASIDARQHGKPVGRCAPPWRQLYSADCRYRASVALRLSPGGARPMALPR